MADEKAAAAAPVDAIFEIDVKAKMVKKTVITTVNAIEYKQVWRMDFSKCDERDMLDLASRCFVIDQQAKMRNKNTDESTRLGMGDGVIDVKANMGKGVARKDAVAKTIEMTKAKMTKEQRAELLKALLEMQEDGEE